MKHTFEVLESLFDFLKIVLAERVDIIRLAHKLSSGPRKRYINTRWESTGEIRSLCQDRLNKTLERSLNSRVDAGLS